MRRYSVVSERLNRKAAYDATGEVVTKWQPIVKTNREKPTLEFGKERDKMQRKETLAGRCRLSPGSPRVDRAWFQRLKLKYDVPLSNFAFNFNLQPYAMAALNADFEPTNDFEKEIMAKLKESGMATGKDVERGEDLAGGVLRTTCPLTLNGLNLLLLLLRASV